MSEKLKNAEPKLASETLIVLNGLDSENANIIDSYNPDSNTWSEFLKLNPYRYRCCSTILDGKLMLIGGSIDNVYSSDVDSYDFETGEYTKLAPMPDLIFDCELTVMSGYLYLVGGIAVGEFPFESGIVRYSPSANQWEVMPYSLRIPRNAAAVAYNDEIYAIGGGGSGAVSDVSAFDPITSTWRKCASMNEKRYAAPAVAFGGFIYVFGGQNETFEYLRTAERYDPISNSWSYISNSNWDRGFTRAVVFNDTIIIAGGIGIDGELSDLVNYVEAYIPNEYRFNILTPMRHTRIYFDLINVPWELIKKSAAKKKTHQLKTTNLEN